MNKKKRIILITAGIMIFSAVAYAAHFWYQINNPKNLFDIPASQDKQGEPSAESDEPYIEPYQFTEDKLNVLLLGLDANEQRYETMGAFRTDTIMLAAIDFTENKVDLISIPRDSYVKIPGRKERGRVNAAFVYGGGFEGKGFDTTIQTVSDLLGGIPIHYYAAIDMNAFIKIIDSLGGITYEVDVPVPNAGIEPGLQKLDGRQALAYARHRKTAGGDIDRVGRQQQLMVSVLNQLKSTDSLSKLPNIYDSIKDDIWTNLNIRQVAALALFAARMDMADLHRHMIPGTFLDMDNISYWGVDQKKKNELIYELFGINITEYDKEDDVYYILTQLRKKLAELRSSAEKWIEKGNQAIGKYGHVMLEEELAKIKQEVTMMEHGLKSGELEDIEIITHGLEKELTSLTPHLEERVNIITQAQAVLSMVEDELSIYEGEISSSEMDQLVGLMNNVGQKMEQKAFEDISGAVTKLDSYWGSLKEKLQNKPSPAPSPVPSPSPSPTPSPTPTPPTDSEDIPPSTTDPTSDGDLSDSETDE